MDRRWALVETEARGWRQGTAPPRWRGELLRLAAWRASRSGLSDVLLSPLTGLPEPTAAVADTLLGHVGGALADTGDIATVRELRSAGPLVSPGVLAIIWWHLFLA